MRFIKLLIYGMSIFSTRAESPGKLEALEAELQEAEKHLAMTSSEHKELLHVMKNQQTSQRMVDILT